MLAPKEENYLTQLPCIDVPSQAMYRSGRSGVSTSKPDFLRFAQMPDVHCTSFETPNELPTEDIIDLARMQGESLGFIRLWMPQINIPSRRHSKKASALHPAKALHC